MKTVKMKRSEPTKPGGPLTADVHKDEVVNYMKHGWIVEEEKKKPEPRPPVPGASGSNAQKG